MCAVAAGMDDALGNALVVEMEDLLAEMRVLHQCRAAGALSQRVLVVGNGRALLGGQDLIAVLGALMCLAAIPHRDILVVIDTLR